MKSNIARVNIDNTVNERGDWWKWESTCDKCGTSIEQSDTFHSVPPDTDEADFCLKCLRELMDNKIPYEVAYKKYKRVEMQV